MLFGRGVGLFRQKPDPGVAECDLNLLAFRISAQQCMKDDGLPKSSQVQAFAGTGAAQGPVAFPGPDGLWLRRWQCREVNDGIQRCAAENKDRFCHGGLVRNPVGIAIVGGVSILQILPPTTPPADDWLKQPGAGTALANSRAARPALS